MVKKKRKKNGIGSFISFGLLFTLLLIAGGIAFFTLFRAFLEWLFLTALPFLGLPTISNEITQALIIIVVVLIVAISAGRGLRDTIRRVVGG